MAKEKSLRQIPWMPDGQKDALYKPCFISSEKDFLLEKLGLSEWKVREVEAKLLKHLGFDRVFPKESESQKVEIDFADKFADLMNAKSVEKNYSDSVKREKVIAQCDKKRVTKAQREHIYKKCGISGNSTIDLEDF